MLRRALLDPIPPADTEVDTTATAQTVGAIERGERHLKMLAELGEIGMRLARSLGQLVDTRVERELKNEVAPGRSEDAAAAFDKMAQTVRRTAALEAMLAAGVKARREGLITERAERRAARLAAHRAAVGDEIIEGLHDAWAATCPDAEYNDVADRLLDDAREYLDDADEMRGYLDRPIGETVAKLCAAMGLDPDACESDGETWRVRRPPLDFELRLEERKRKYPPPPSVGVWGGTAGEAVRVGLSPENPNSIDNPTQPHPGCFASGPSP